MKKLLDLKGAKLLSKTDQKTLKGGRGICFTIFCDGSENCPGTCVCHQYICTAA